MTDTSPQADYPEHLYNEELWCVLLRAEFDLVAHVANLHLYDGDCVDARGAINFAKRVDPKVRQIITFSGDNLDTVYDRKGDDWEAEIVVEMVEFR